MKKQWNKRIRKRLYEVERLFTNERLNILFENKKEGGKMDGGTKLS